MKENKNFSFVNSINLINDFNKENLILNYNNLMKEFWQLVKIEDDKSGLEHPL